MTYEIGYRRPPEDRQFKKGQSGNPKGRPKGSKNFFTLLNMELDLLVEVNDNGKKKKITRRHAFAKRLVAGAVQGDLKTQAMLLAVLKSELGIGTDSLDEHLPDDHQEILEAYVVATKNLQAGAPVQRRKNK